MPTIPAWLYSLIKMAIQIGSPYLLTLIKKWIGNLPADVVALINDLIDGITNPAVSTREAKIIAKSRLAGVRRQLQVTPDAQDVKEI